MAQGEIHANDVGVALQSQIFDQDGKIVDLSNATQIDIILQPPSGPPMTVTGSFITDGRDGWVQYITQPNDLYKYGMWRMQVYVTLTGGLVHSDTSSFKVYQNLV